MSDSLVLSPANILVVDDEPHVCEIVRRILVPEGHSCAVANSSDEAWAYLQAQDVDLITLDVRMPGQSGVELLKRIHDEFPDTSVIMLTGVGGADTAIQALTYGACGFLTKPIDLDELLFYVKRGLERQQLIVERHLHVEQLEERVRQQTETIRRAHEETILRLVGASMYRDEETGAHVKRVGLFSAVLAEATGWPAAEAERIRMAAPMHDVGKIGIPDAILQKPGKLTHDEFEIMKSHAVIGAELLEGSESPMLETAHDIALHHHERWDGQRYPHGLAAMEIQESSRIVAIADVYDALTHDRVYRPALPEEKALAMMRADRGRHFDPHLLDLFFEVLPEIRTIAGLNPDAESEEDTGGSALQLLSNADNTAPMMHSS